jgi:hypothetical protein
MENVSTGAENRALTTRRLTLNAAVSQRAPFTDLVDAAIDLAGVAAVGVDSVGARKNHCD